MLGFLWRIHHGMVFDMTSLIDSLIAHQHRPHGRAVAVMLRLEVATGGLTAGRRPAPTDSIHEGGCSDAMNGVHHEL